MGFEFSEMVRLKENMVKLTKATAGVHMKVAKQLAQMAIRRVKKMTPVDQGDLRDNWKYHILKKGDTYTIIIYNTIEYASFVEKGHRIVRNGKTVGWVEGRFMLQLTMDEMEAIAPAAWLEKVEKEMRRILGG
ncbi:HK97 gp10 family phage protein [Sporosarcina contaminans]|uniref:HK97 gp10 family phage protein n=1 Tax=Sporosarcina contaminans TaxID=633403 RepID=A0ABW3TTN2_9BACL